MSATPALLVTTFLRERIGTLLGVVVVLCNLAAIALGALSLQQSHQNAEAQAETAAVSLAHMLDQSLSSSARSIDVGLQALADELGREARGGSHYLQTDEVMALLARVKSWLPETEGIRVFDANGRPRWTQHSTPESAQETCQCFDTLRAAPDGGLVVGRPIARRGAAGWLIPFSRRISGPGGRFSGIVSVTVPLDAFTELLARPLLGKGGSAILRYRDFGLITQVPPVAGAAGVVGHVWIAEEIRSRPDELHLQQRRHFRQNRAPPRRAADRGTALLPDRGLCPRPLPRPMASRCRPDRRDAGGLPVTAH